MSPQIHSDSAQPAAVQPAAAAVVVEHGYDRRFQRRFMIVATAGLLLLLGWVVSGLLLVVFASVLVAILLHGLSTPLRRYFRLGHAASLAGAGMIALSIIISTFMLFGATVESQISALGQLIPDSWRLIREQLHGNPAGNWIIEQLGALPHDHGVAARMSRLTVSVGSGLLDILFALAGGVYLAAQPGLYRVGFLRLLPRRHRALAADTLDETGRALGLWLMGQLGAMAIVGVLISAGLVAIGIPSALALGLIAAIGEFIPMIGTTLAIVPAVLMAAPYGLAVVMEVIALYVLVQQLEGMILMPLIQKRMVYLAPALTLFSILLFGLLFGVPGLLLAAPLTVLCVVIVKKVYMEAILGEPVQSYAPVAAGNPLH